MGTYSETRTGTDNSRNPDAAQYSTQLYSPTGRSWFLCSALHTRVRDGKKKKKRVRNENWHRSRRCRGNSDPGGRFKRNAAVHVRSSAGAATCSLKKKFQFSFPAPAGLFAKHAIDRNVLRSPDGHVADGQFFSIAKIDNGSPRVRQNRYGFRVGARDEFRDFFRTTVTIRPR